MMHSFMEEEAINLFLMFFLIPSGGIIRMGIHFCLSLWAIIHVSELFNSILKVNPNAIGVSAMRPLIEYVIVSKVEIAMLKNTIEVTIGAICIPMIFMNQVALIFPIIYTQYVRIKFVSSFFMRESCTVLNKAIIERIIPQSIRDTAAYQWVVNYVKSYVHFPDEKKKGKEGEEKKEEEKSFREEDTKVDAGEEYAKQFTQG